MPANTPIFGFPYPLGTDPVAQGDNDIRALAEDVETVVAQNGLWLVKTVSVGGSGVPAVDVTSAFSSSYDNYLIAYSDIDASVNAAGLFFRFGTVPSPVNANYKFGGFFSGYSGTVLNLLQSNPGYWEVGGTNTNNSSGCFTVNGPHLVAHSTFSAQFARTDAAFVISGIHEATVQHTSFHLYPSSGTIANGTIRVYGYKN